MSGGGERARELLSYAVVPLALIFVWQLAVSAGAVSPRLVPSPADVAATLADLAFRTSGGADRYSGDLWEHAGASLVRVCAGFGLAAAMAVPLGVAIGLSPAVERLVDPTIQLLRNIPITGFVPIAIVLFGFGDRPAIYLIALAAFFPSVVNTSYGVRQLSPLLVRSGLMMGATRAQVVTRIVVPAAMPAIFTGLRLSLGVAWVLVVVAEFIGVRSGLGYLLFDAYQFFRPDAMIAAMASIGLLGFLSDRALLLVRSRVLAWNRLGTLRG